MIYSGASRRILSGTSRQIPGFLPNPQSSLGPWMPSPLTAWDGALRRLAAATPPLALKAWILPLGIRAEGPTLVLVAPTAFHAERVRTRYLAALQSLLVAEAGELVPVRIEVDSELVLAPEAAGELAVEERAAAPVAALTAGVADAPGLPAARVGAGPVRTSMPVRANVLRVAPASEPAAQLALPHTFDTFVVGPGNALAREASLAVARGRALGGGPLCLVGPAGTGKIASRARRRSRSAPQRCTASALHIGGSVHERADGLDPRAGYARLPATLPPRAATCSCSRTCSSSKARTRRSSSSSTRSSTCAWSVRGSCSPRIACHASSRASMRASRSQLSSGLVAEMEPARPRAAARHPARSKAARGGFRLPSDCLELLVDAVHGSVRDLEGVLIQLVGERGVAGAADRSRARRGALRKVRGPSGAALSLDDVIDSVAQFFGVRRADLASRSRRRATLRPRQLAMYLCRQLHDCEPVRDRARPRSRPPGRAQRDATQSSARCSSAHRCVIRSKSSQPGSSAVERERCSASRLPRSGRARVALACSPRKRVGPRHRPQTLGLERRRILRGVVEAAQDLVGGAALDGRAAHLADQPPHLLGGQVLAVLASRTRG